MTATEQRPAEVDVEQLAAEWACSPGTIRHYIRSGQLRAVKIAGSWRIHREDIEIYRESRANMTRRRQRHAAT